MRILVVGGTRFIGAHTVRALHATGAEITVLHRGRTDNPVLPPVEHIVDPSARYPIVAFPDAVKRDFDVVVHMVAMGEADATAAVQAFAGRTGRLVLVSSCDVYRAYGRLTQSEPGEPEPVPLTEDAPLRTSRYPYRGMAAQIGDYADTYEKILAEEAVRGAAGAPDWTILRLPKVYGPEDNADLGTVYGFAAVPDWRWTHAHVENVAAAIATASLHPKARNRIFNIGEETTPTMGERLAVLPKRPGEVPEPPPFDFRQALVLDTSRGRRDLGVADVVDEAAAMRQSVSASP